MIIKEEKALTWCWDVCMAWTENGGVVERLKWAWSEIRFSPLSTGSTTNSSLCLTSEGVVTTPLLVPAEEVTELNN